MGRKIKATILFNLGSKKMIKIISVVGTRPQFIKAAVMTRAIAAYNKNSECREKFFHIIVHTGQHYDDNMSKIFFHQLNIPQPAYNLGVGSGSHGTQTGKMLMNIEKVLLKEKADLVLTYGDTNSALAGALAAAKMSIPIAHIEAGLRSYNREMPEEINRILIDHISRFCFCPTHSAVENLKKEGILKGVYNTGDVMYEAVKSYIKIAENKSDILFKLNLKPKKYYLMTIHRQSNTDNRNNLKDIVRAIYELDLPVIFPIHPRTKKNLIETTPQIKKRNIVIINPVSYFDMLVLEKNSKVILTDSGGVQKEAYFFAVPCITLRDETEWVETVEEGWNIVVGTNKEKIIASTLNFNPPKKQKKIFGNAQAGNKIVKIIQNFHD